MYLKAGLDRGGGHRPKQFSKIKLERKRCASELFPRQFLVSNSKGKGREIQGATLGLGYTAVCKTFWQVLSARQSIISVDVSETSNELKRVSRPIARHRALSCVSLGPPHPKYGAGCLPPGTRVCVHTLARKSLFFQSSNGLTSTPATLPEDRQALELHLFLARGCTF